MLDNLFTNIGAKIKRWAEVIFYFEVISAILGGLALLSTNAGIGLIVLICGPLTAWLSSAILYAFGELTEDIRAIRDKEGTTAEVRAKHEAEEAAIRAKLEAEEIAKLKAEEQLRVSDIEDTVSAHLKHRVSISDITCTLIYVIPKSTGLPKEMHLDMAVDGQEFTSLDLFFDENRSAYFFNGRHLALDGAWRSEEEIFGFDVSLFKDFHTEVDEED